MINELKNSILFYCSGVKLNEICIKTYQKLNKVGNTNIPYLHVRVSLVSWSIFVLAMGITIGAFATCDESSSLQGRVSKGKAKSDEQESSNDEHFTGNLPKIEELQAIHNINSIQEFVEENMNRPGKDNNEVKTEQPATPSPVSSQPPPPPPPPPPAPGGKSTSSKFPNQIIDDQEIEEPVELENSLLKPSENENERKANSDRIAKYINDMNIFLRPMKPVIEEWEQLKKKAIEQENGVKEYLSEIKEIDTLLNHLEENKNQEIIILNHEHNNQSYPLPYYSENAFVKANEEGIKVSPIYLQENLKNHLLQQKQEKLKEADLEGLSALKTKIQELEKQTFGLPSFESLTELYKTKMNQVEKWKRVKNRYDKNAQPKKNAQLKLKVSSNSNEPDDSFDPLYKKLFAIKDNQFEIKSKGKSIYSCISLK